MSRKRLGILIAINKKKI